MAVNRPENLRSLATFAIAVLLSGGSSLGSAAEPRETERQTREFKVSVDGTERGKTTMRIARRDDGALSVKIDSRLNFNYVVYAYRYSSSGAETWKDGRLVELENTADYNGTRYLVKAGPHRRTLQVTVNGKASENERDAWSTSYWQIPERLASPDSDEGKGVVHANGQRPSARPGPMTVPLLDADKGRALRGKLECVGEETVVVAGKRRLCTHYRVAGDVQVELWFDESRRLVRLESIDQGHKTLLELMRITDEP
jgi:hypothetical protein